MSTQEKIKAFFSDFGSKMKNAPKGAKYGTIAGIVVVIAMVVWGLYWFPKRSYEAAKMKAHLHYFFENDSMSVVLKGYKEGKVKVMGAPEIAKKYWMTKAGKEAAIMAGLAYMKTGKWQEAIDFLDKTNVREPLLGSVLMGAKAGCYAELKKYEKAADLYLKAAEFGDNELSDKFYLYSGMHYELAKDYKSAANAYELGKANASDNASQYEQEMGSIDKYIAKAKALLGKYKE